MKNKRKSPIVVCSLKGLASLEVNPQGKAPRLSPQQVERIAGILDKKNHSE